VLPSSLSKLGTSAVACAERFGAAVFPLAPKSKLPLIAAKFGGKGVLDATKNVVQIRKWWDINPEANIGIATGAASGFFALDIDAKNDGEETLSELERVNGALPKTVAQHTGGGGRHFLFRHVAGIRNSAGKVGKGIDIRGDGGYIVVPPSIHENGRAYAWDVDQHPAETPIAEAPRWLLQALLKDHTACNAHAGEPLEPWRKLVAEGVCEGARNEAVARLAGHLLRKDVDPFVVLDLLRCWNAERCRPPLPAPELVKTVDSICCREHARRAERSTHGKH
jgi:hypothetical protein